MESENVAEKPRESFDIPGVGELRARPGTSTAELAGAVDYWHKKAKASYADGISVGKIVGRKDGAIAAISLVTALEVVIGIAYHYLRSH